MKYSEGYLLDNRYLLERFIGSGTFGEVWVAVDKATDLEVAVKVYVSMDEKGLEEFKKEFQISFELNHTNLLHANYLGVNSEDKRPYLVMPFCPEGSVTKFAGEMKEADLWRFIRDVSSGLAYLHSKQPPIIHQDIKPDNILIIKNGDFVITDFGISRQLRATLRKSAASTSSAGAISYMGPERFSKQYQAVKASDIWSLGVSIFELATGELPFCGMGGSLLKQGADMPELPEEYSPVLNMVCQSCMAKEPWSRPTAQQLADYAARYIEGENPKITWDKTGGLEAKLVGNNGHEPQATPSNQFNQTVAMNASLANAPEHDINNVPSQPAFNTPYIPDAPKKTILPWIVSAVAGLLTGILINLFV